MLVWPIEGKVGNSGFSLKKISAFRNIHRPKDHAIDPGEFWQTSYAQDPPGHRLLNIHKRLLMYSRRFKHARFEMDR